MTMERVIQAETLWVHFKAYLLESVLRRYFKMLKEPRTAPYARVLKNALINGGVGFGRGGQIYREHLLHVLEHVDTIPFLGKDFDELEQAIKEAHGDQGYGAEPAFLVNCRLLSLALM